MTLSALAALPDHGDKGETMMAVHAWTELTWKCEDQDPLGRSIGPAILSDVNDARDFDAQWHTRAEARAIARRLHVRYTEDC